MSQKLQPVRGMKDLLPNDYAIAECITDLAKDISIRYGFRQVSTPIVEHSGVFSRSLGEFSDVVSKEMYTFPDKGGDSLTLRPEFTAGVMRAVISGGLDQTLPLRLFSTGPCFRYDRPQAGRQRQFHHLNFEFLGVSSPYADAEMIAMARDLCDTWGILDDVTIEVNSIGCMQSRENYHTLLLNYFEAHTKSLSEDSLKRLAKNPMRILDSKDEGDKKIVESAPHISESYTKETREYFDSVLKYMDLMNIKYVINPRLVRGLDYYCHTAFEFTTTKLGAQSSVLGGGRYDGLAKLMGGADIPACGFAAGLERIMLLKDFNVTTVKPFVVISIGDENIDHAALLTQELRVAGIAALLEHKGKVGKRMQSANNVKARAVIFVGSEEVESGQYKIRDMDTGLEKFCSKTEIVSIASLDHTRSAL